MGRRSSGQAVDVTGPHRVAVLGRVLQVLNVFPLLGAKALCKRECYPCTDSSLRLVAHGPSVVPPSGAVALCGAETWLGCRCNVRVASLHKSADAAPSGAAVRGSGTLSSWHNR